MDNFREITTFLIGLAALIGCGLLIFTSRGSEEQAWLMIGIILAYYFNRQQQSSAVRDVISSQPSQTITTSDSSGPTYNRPPSWARVWRGMSVCPPSRRHSLRRWNLSGANPNPNQEARVESERVPIGVTDGHTTEP